MCLWLLTACLGLLPSSPTPTTVVIVQGVPTPILQPTTAAPTTTAATTTTSAATTTSTRPPTTVPPATSTPAPTTARPTTAPPATTAAPTTAAPTTAAPTTAAPTTAAPTTAAPTTAAPTTAGPTTAAPPATTASPMTTTTTPRPTSPGNDLTSQSSIVANLSSPQLTNFINSREEILPVVICTDPDVICITNPDENASGTLPIDPRVGTTPAASAALQAPPISGYSAQAPSYDTAVRFPRERRSVDDRRYNRKINLLNIMKGIQTLGDNNHDIEKRQSCRCVTAGTCVTNSTNSGAGMIDVRIVTPAGQCPSGQEYCCGSTIIACGTLQTVPTTAIAPAAGQANFGEYPWQALILTKQNDYLAGGVLIDQLNVVTVTHRLTSYIVSGTAPNVKVRLGEWDAAGTYEPVPYQEYTVQKVFSHPSYNANTLQFDITVLRLSASVPFTPRNGSATTINRACLPPSSTTTYTGQRCWVAGWGKDMFGMQGQYQQILKEVDVPIVAPATCQTQMQTARLGSSFVLDTTSFVCAGGEANKDSCTGDGGSGLVCQANGQWTVVGLVAWGLGCAGAGVPAAYVNVAALLPWIQQQVAAA